jgi:hypothetical protein
MQKHWKNIHTHVIVEVKRETINTHTKPVFKELYCPKCENKWNNLERYKKHICNRTTKKS